MGVGFGTETEQVPGGPQFQPPIAYVLENDARQAEDRQILRHGAAVDPDAIRQGLNRDTLDLQGLAPGRDLFQWRQVLADDILGQGDVGHFLVGQVGHLDRDGRGPLLLRVKLPQGGQAAVAERQLVEAVLRRARTGQGVL